MRKRCRSTRLEEFFVSREHIFHDTSLDEDMERELEERERTGGAIAPLWTRWLLMNRKQEESRDDDIDAQGSQPSLATQEMHSPREAWPLPKRPAVAQPSAAPAAVSQVQKTPSKPALDLREFSDNPLSSRLVVDIPATPNPRHLPRNAAVISSAASSTNTPSSSRSSRKPPHLSQPPVEPETSSINSSVLDQLRHKAPYQATQHQIQRDRIQAEWDEAVRSAKAASIKIVNGVDDELINLPNGFQYLEYGYWSEDGSDSGEFMTGCDCLEGLCRYPMHCCADLMQMDRRIFPYTWGGLFTFNIPHGTEIIECNKKCPCDNTCRNRVAQIPRSIPLEVFKTRKCGWGVRATVQIKRGQVIGVYSGELISREKANKLSGVRRTYVFDLDHLEGDDDDDEDEPDFDKQFSVDGYLKGNWGRFINHSCDPNMIVWPVLYDTAEVNKCYLAFIASKDVPIRAELTLDYHPHSPLGTEVSSSKGKKKSKDEGCLCGAERCRGWRP